MQRYFFILAALVCLICPRSEEHNVAVQSVTAFDLTPFEESAEEFSELFEPIGFDTDILMGKEYEFVENSFPAPKPQEPSLIPNRVSNTSSLMPDYILTQVVPQKIKRIPSVIKEYSLLLPFIYYHPPQA
jgi:hypothetical protein